MHPVIDLLQRNYEINPEGIALVTPDERLTNAELHKRVKLLAGKIRSLGVGAGDLVATVLWPEKNWPTILAVLHEGAIVMPGDSLKKMPYDKPRLLIAQRAIPGADPDRTLVGSDLDELFSSQDSIDLAPAEITSLDQTCWITHTSGTTGRPKGIEFSYAFALRPNPYLAEDGVERRTLGFFGLPSNSGFSLAMRDLRNNQAYLGLGPSAPEVNSVIEEFSVNELLGSPIQLVGYLQNLKSFGHTPPKGIEVVRPGGSKSPPQLVEQIHLTLNAEVRASYATTEAGTLARRTLKPGDDFSNVGKVVAGVEVQVLDEEGNQLPKGSVGILRFRKPGMITNYFEDPEADARAFRDGWFYNGDLGMLSTNDELILRGRVDDVVNLGGEKVSLISIEEHAMTFPGVIDAACCLIRVPIGLPVVALGFVSEAPIKLNGLLESLSVEFGLEAPKLAARLVRIPRNENGKINRVVLSEAFAQQLNKRKKAPGG